MVAPPPPREPRGSFEGWRDSTSSGADSRETRDQRETSADSKLRLSVENSLHWDLAVPKNCVGVQVCDGWVTLSGEVEREYHRSSAEADARKVAGVAGVTNRIEIIPRGAHPDVH